MNFLTPLSMGYSEDQVFDFLASSFPNLGRKLRQAARFGHDVKSILKSFQGLDKKKLKELDKKAKLTPDLGYSPLVQAQRKTAETSGEETIKKYATNAAKLGASLAAPYAASYAASKIAPAGLSMIEKAAPRAGEALRGLIGKIGPTPMSNAPVQPSPTQQTTPTLPPPETGLQSQKTSGALPKTPARQEVENYLLNNPEFKDWLNRKIALETEVDFSQVPIEKLIDDFKKEKEIVEKHFKSPFMKGIAEDVQKMEQPRVAVEEAIEEPEEKPSGFEKGEIVILPQGAGEIKSERNGQALVDVAGKLEKLNTNDIFKSPLPKKDLADLYDDVIAGIEAETGEEVSRNVNYAGYDPESNTLAYLPHDGRLYLYNDISPEDIQSLTKFLKERKSTGENRIGGWVAGSKSPIGAAMSALIEKLQKDRGGKGKEYEKRFETVYKALEIAERASQKKYRKKKKDERKRPR